ncbi:acetyltransferase [Nonlabens ponticola]|uniref:Acetyltransferase n=1 Tax=Nonlabens ponticola TaxID=2496866 RepID=A0A3S9N160_9FLAO|nr:acetyltransferase [Nonlabens ponticola]
MYVYGAGGHGKVIAEILKSNAVDVNGFIDQDISIHRLLEKNVKHTIEETDRIVLAIGANEARKKLFIKYHEYVAHQHFAHSKSNVSDTAAIGIQTVVMAGAVVNAQARIGKGCIINTNATIEHDCIIADFVHISPGATLAGNVTVGEGSHIGINASVIPGVSIGKGCTIGAGSVIIKDVPDSTTVVGNPGHIIKQGD